MGSKLYVGNLSYNVTEEQLRELFSQAGTIKEVALIMDRDTQRPKGFGFVEMTSQVEAQKAIELFNEHELDQSPYDGQYGAPQGRPWRFAGWLWW